MIYIVTYILSYFLNDPNSTHISVRESERKEVFESRAQMIEFCGGHKVIAIDSAILIK